MTRIAYVDGRYLPLAEAVVQIEDRGYQFADGIYEYIAFYNKKLVDAEPHLQRWQRSIDALSLPSTYSLKSLHIIMQQLLSRNPLQHGGLYMQITRGVSPRNHPFPKHPHGVLSMTIRASKTMDSSKAEKGVKAITHADERWARCDIKTINLLANLLAKQYAIASGAFEALLIKPDGFISEGAVSNVFMVDETGTLCTHPATSEILPGITRARVIEMASATNITVLEKAFTLKQLQAAQEVFITSTSANVQPVVQIDQQTIGNGKVGRVTQTLMNTYYTHIHTQTGYTV